MPDLENKKTAAARKNPPANLRPPTSSPKEVAIEDDTNSPATIHAQGRNRKVRNLAENCLNRQSPRLNPTTNQNEDPVPLPPTTHNQSAKAAPTAAKSALPKRISGTTREQKAVYKA